MKHRHFINSALLDNNVGKIEMYGDVYEEIPIDWWTGEPIVDQAITLKDVKNALEELKDCSRLEIHLNSYGGDATVGLTIHNLLRGMNKHITCVIDGIAASAAFTIASACDDVQVYPGSLMMCHKVMSLLMGYYNSDALNKVINGNTAYDKASAAVYAKKTGMSEAQCLNLMKNETWMTGQQALEYGFANTLLDDEDSKYQLINKTTMKINGINHDISGLNIPDDFIQHTNEKTNLGGKSMSKESLQTKLINAITSIFKNDAEIEEEVKEEAVIEEVKEEPANEEVVEEVKADEVENVEGKEENKEEVVEENNQEVVNSAIEAERKRIQEIEKIANEIDADLVQEAKFTNVCDAAELALRAKQREAERTNQALEDLKEDTASSKVNEVESVQSEPDPEDEALSQTQIENSVKAMFAKINKAKEGK